MVVEEVTRSVMTEAGKRSSRLSAVVVFGRRRGRERDSESLCRYVGSGSEVVVDSTRCERCEMTALRTCGRAVQFEHGVSRQHAVLQER